MVLLIAGVAMIGLGTAAFGHFVLGAFPNFGEAIWSSIAHLVDPGSIGDDNTSAERVVGLVQVIAGIVFFAGIVLTVLTEVVDRALRSLEKGDPAVRRHDHLLIIGSNPSLRDVQRQLRDQLGPNPPEIVVMLPTAQVDRRDDVRRALAGYPVRTSVVAADPGADGYERVSAERARSIVILSPEGEPDPADVEATDRAVLLHSYLSEWHSSPPVAVEVRRSRNVKALWYLRDQESDSISTRFPDNFDALVNDRNIGAVLSLAVINPAFADVFLSDDANAGPALLPADGFVGEPFGQVAGKLPGRNVLGVLRGEGPGAAAAYLPDGQQPVGSGDRLIVMESGLPDQVSRTDDPVDVSLEPVPPANLLLIDWSDASRALLEDLSADGIEPNQVHLLDRQMPVSLPDAPGAVIPELVAGNPASSSDIHHAIELSRPDIVLVAAPDENESSAIVAGMLARQATSAPIIVEQSFSEEEARNRRIAADLIPVSTGAMIAGTVASSLTDPALLVARERMLADPGLILETLRYRGHSPLSTTALPNLLPSGAVALTVSGGEDELQPGDRVLVLRRVAPVPA